MRNVILYCKEDNYSQVMSIAYAIWYCNQNPKYKWKNIPKDGKVLTINNQEDGNWKAHSFL